MGNPVESRGETGSRAGISRRRFLELAGLITVAGAVAACSTTERAPKPIPTPIESSRGFQKGIVLTSWTRGELAKEGTEALQRIARMGANSLELIPSGYQKNAQDTEIRKDALKTSSDDELTATIDRARSFDINNILLKPHVDNDNNDWRGNIGSNGLVNDKDWRSKWFRSYTGFIVPYAALAQEAGVQLFSVGNEMKGVSGADVEWGEVVEKIRGEYGGRLTYGLNYGENINWLSQIDDIGLSAYLPYESSSIPTYKQLQEGWRAYYKDVLLPLSAQNGGKNVIFTEYGCGSFTGASKKPWLDGKPEDTSNQKEQATWLQAGFDAMDPVVTGVYVWNEYAQSKRSKDATTDTSHSIDGKAAEHVIVDFFRSVK